MSEGKRSRKKLLAEIAELKQRYNMLRSTSISLLEDYERCRAYASKLVKDKEFYDEAVAAYNDKSLECPCPSCEENRNSSTAHLDQQ